MAQYTQLKTSEINELAKAYGLPDLEYAAILEGGSENTNYLLRTDTEAYVLTICENKTAQETEILVNTLHCLKKNKFATTEVYKAVTGKYITFYRGKPVILKSYLEGAVYDQLPHKVLSSLGSSLAQLHQISAPTCSPNKVNYSLEKFSSLRQQYGRSHTFIDWLDHISEFISPFLKLDLPRCLIHGDVFNDNVIVDSEGQPIIMDFEEACNYYRIFDLGMTIVGTCTDNSVINPDAVKHFLSGYQAEAELSNEEKAAFKPFTIYAAAGMAYWRFKQFNILFPGLGQQNHYLELQQTAEMLLTISNDDFLDLLEVDNST